MDTNSFKSRVKGSIKVFLGMAIAIPRIKEEKFYCPVCDSNLTEYLRMPDHYEANLDAFGFIHSSFLFETINRIQYACPKCWASDRYRLYALYLNKEFANINESYKVLDFAPPAAFQRYIKRKFNSIHHRSADFLQECYDDKVDITRMDLYADNSFDFFICSHVLEHVEDDKKGMSELYRVLKPGGKGIAMVPILLSLDKDYEDPSIKTAEDKWRHYGQDDHVRMYSKPGFVNKLKDTGFKVNQLGIDYFGAEVFIKNGIHPRSVLYIVEK